MSSAQGYTHPPTLTEESEEEHLGAQQTEQEDQLEDHQPESRPRQIPEPQQDSEPRQDTELVQSQPPSVRGPDHPPQTPPKDRDSEGRLSVSGSPRFSQFVDWSATTQPSLTAAAQLISHSASQPEDRQMPNTTSARSFVNHPITAGNEDTDNGHETNATESTLSILNRSTGGRNTVNNTFAASAGLETTRPVLATPNTPQNQNRSLTYLPPPRPRSAVERRQTGSGLIQYDPVRGDPTFQAPYPLDLNGHHDREYRASSPIRNGSRRVSVPRPRLTMTDETVIENGAEAWAPSRRASRLVSRQDLLVGVPVIERPPREKTVEDRLRPTIDSATAERDKYRKRSSRQSLMINGAIGVQIIVGAMTTGIAASGTAHIGAAVASLGGLSTILASYLAKVRGSGEPEFSTTRARELNSFLREVETFVLDHGDEIGTDFIDQIRAFRDRFEMIIKTDGEDSGYSRQPPPSHPPQHAVPHAVHLASGYPASAPGVHDSRGLSEKQQYTCKVCGKDEKAISAMA